jgi:hypothetical protein
VSDETPIEATDYAANRGSLAADLGALGLPDEVTLPGGYPGTGGTCGEILEPFASCAIRISVAPTQPAEGENASVPLAIYYADSEGYDVTRLAVNWSWLSE